MSACVMCGSSPPDNQGSSTCSMCYGDIDHGHDGYYRQWAEEQQNELAPTEPAPASIPEHSQVEITEGTA